MSRVLDFSNRSSESHFSDELDEVDTMIASDLMSESLSALLSLQERFPNERESEGIIMRLGLIHETDHFENPVLNYDAAYDYYELASDVYGSAEAFLAMANLHYLGVIKGSEIDTSLKLLTHLADEGYYANGLVYWILGRIFLLGMAGNKDYGVAAEYFSNGWKLGHIPSLGALGYTKRQQGNEKYCAGLLLQFRAFIAALTLSYVDPESSRMRLR